MGYKKNDTGIPPWIFNYVAKTGERAWMWSFLASACCLVTLRQAPKSVTNLKSSTAKCYMHISSLHKHF